MMSESLPDYTRVLLTAAFTIIHYIVGPVLFVLVHWQAHQKTRNKLEPDALGPPPVL